MQFHFTNFPKRFYFKTILLSSIISTTLVHAQEHQRAHVGFTYPLSSNGIQAPHMSNSFSLHALIGVSGGENGAAISGLATIVNGTQKGVLISGLTNITTDTAKGAAIAGLTNINNDLNGAQIAGLVNVADSLKGCQIAGLSNISNTATTQIAGLWNISKSSKLQVAGLSNVGKNDLAIQVSGLINIVKHSKYQIGGLINIAKKVEGVQIAGLINIAEESKYPIGFINIIKNGEKQLGIGIDEIGNTTLSFRSGGKVTYGIIGIGHNFNFSGAPHVLELGLGAHLPLNHRFRINFELNNTANTNFWTVSYYKSALRTLVGLQLGKTIELTAGPSFNYVNYMSGLKPYSSNEVFKFYGTQSTNTLFVGGYIGLNFRL